MRRSISEAANALSAVALVVHVMNTGVERQFNEQMGFRVIEVGDYRTLEITNRRGDTVMVGSTDVVARVRSRTNRTARVSMIGWYDYGRLRAFRIQSIDGVGQ